MEKPNFSQHIIICGLGHIGFRTFEILHRLNEKIIIISDRTFPEWESFVRSSGAYLIQGDARDEGVLRSAQIEKAKAILALTDQDLVNISIAMDARKLNPHIRISVRMYDTEVGDNLKRVLKINHVFSVSELCAPVFLSTLKGESSFGLLKFKDHEWSLQEFKNDQSSVTQDRFPILEMTHQEITKYNPENKVDKKNLVLCHTLAHHKNPDVSDKTIHFFGRLHNSVPQGLRTLFLVLIIVLMASATLISYEMKLSLIDSAYFAMATITTVGYGDFNFKDASAGMKIFGMFLMLFGASSLAISFGYLTEMLLSEKFKSFLKIEIIPKENHAVLYGSGHMSDRIIENCIQSKNSLVVIENQNHTQYSEDLKKQTAVVHGNPKNETTLIEAHIQRAKSFLVISENDIENLSIAMAAKKMNPGLKTGVSVFDKPIALKLQNHFNVDQIHCPPMIAAPYFVGSVYASEVLFALDWHHHSLVFFPETENISIPENTEVIDFQIREKKLKVLILKN